MKRIVTLLLLLASLTAFGQTTDSVRSTSLGRTKYFTVLLPEGYSRATNYPVLYLLHGLGGRHTDWTQKSGVREYARAYQFVIVMPDGENSWYVNAVNDPQEKYEDFMINELPAYVNSHYAIDTAKQAIAGLSMGGYGSLMLAFRHPGRFLFAGDLSGAIVPFIAMNAMVQRNPTGYMEKSIMRALGDTEGAFQDEHNVFMLESKMPAASRPFVYIAVGIQDPYALFLPSHRVLTDSLRAHGALYEYHEIPGTHNWVFWDREVQLLLKQLAVIFKK